MQLGLNDLSRYVSVRKVALLRQSPHHTLICSCRNAEKGVDKKKQPKLPAPAAAEQLDKAQSEKDEELYEQVPRHRATETVKERERADLLPVKVNGELVYQRDAKTGDRPLPAVRSFRPGAYFIACGKA